MTAADWVNLALALIAIGMSGAALIYTRRQAIAAEAMVPPPQPKVAWQVSTLGEGYHALRNIGTEASRNPRGRIGGARMVVWHGKPCHPRMWRKPAGVHRRCPRPLSG